jgi:hypothetical protein
VSDAPFAQEDGAAAVERLYIAYLMNRHYTH